MRSFPPTCAFAWVLMACSSDSSRSSGANNALDATNEQGSDAVPAEVPDAFEDHEGGDGAVSVNVDAAACPDPKAIVPGGSCTVPQATECFGDQTDPAFFALCCGGVWFPETIGGDAGRPCSPSGDGANNALDATNEQGSEAAPAEVPDAFEDHEGGDGAVSVNVDAAACPDPKAIVPGGSCTVPQATECFGDQTDPAFFALCCSGVWVPEAIGGDAGRPCLP